MSTTLKDSTQLVNTELQHENKLLYLWGITNLLVIMNTTMFNVALPFILQDFSLSSSTASWLVSGYSIMFAISTTTFSRLSDFIPLSTLLLIGLSLFGVASLIGFFSNHFYLLLSARILQAAGAGSIMGLGMIVAGRYIPLTRRGRAMAIISSTASLAFGLGPVIGGIIIQYVGWHYLFFITGIAVLSIPLLKKLLPEEPRQKGYFDVKGALLITVSVIGLLLFVSTFSYILLILSAIFMIVTWIYLNKAKHAFVPPTLLKNKQYIKLVYIGGTNFFINFSNLFLMPIILTTVYGKSPLEVGLYIFPGAFLAMIAGPYIGRLIDRFGSIRFIFAGQILLLSVAVLFTWVATLSAYIILVVYMFASIGFTTGATAVSNEVSRMFSPKEIGSAMGVSQLLQFIGGAIGVSVSGLLLTMFDGLSSEIIYRNLYGCLSIVITLAIIVCVFYRRGYKVREVN